MSDIISAIHDDIEEYVRLCKLHNEEVQYVRDAYGHMVEDCYGEHAEKLLERRSKE